MAASMAGFACNDAAMKFSFQTIPVAQGVFMRGVFATLFIALLCWRMGAFAYRPSRRTMGFLALRTTAELGATLSFLQAISIMPLASATSMLQVVPLVVTMAAALVLGETVGWRRWSAIAVGFVGVIIMIQPGEAGFSSAMLLPLVTIACVTVRDITTRFIDPDTPSVFASVLTTVAVTSFSGILMPFEGMAPVTLEHLMVFAVAAGFIMIGYIMSVAGMRHGDVAAVAPFRYSVLVWAMSLGYLIFGEVPSLTTLVGAATVVAAGLYTVWRETRLGRGHVAATASTRPFSPDERRR